MTEDFRAELKEFRKMYKRLPFMGFDEPTPVGDPECEVCKACSCYKTCFSGMDGFPKTSSNFGKPQATCAKHQDKCGIKHYDHQSSLEQFTGVES